MATNTSIQVAAAVIQRDGRYLITQRSAHTHLAGYWEFPGGKQEEGESLEACLVREVREELNVEVSEITPFIVIHHDYPDKSVDLHFFLCTLVKGELKALGCADFRWVHPEEFANFSFPPADEPVVTQLQERDRMA